MSRLDRRFDALRRMPAPGLLLLVAMLAAGCQRTLWSQPPASTNACDASLVGYWVSVDRIGNPDGEVEATFTADCQVAVVEHRPDGPRAWPPVVLASARIGRRDVLWLDAGSVNRAFGIDAGPVDREGSVYVFAYRLDGARLELWQPDHRRLARRVLEGELDGAVLVDGHDIAVRLDGAPDQLARLLDERRSFQRSAPLRFRRSTVPAAPPPAH
jgi:hypothetical protein